MSFSLEFSGLALIRLLRSAALLFHTLISFSLLSDLLPRLHSPTRPSARAVKDELRVSAYVDLHHPPSETCAVCLSEMEPSDEVRELQNCSHVFHRGCLDRWLDHDDQGTCPLCRAPLLRRTVSPPPPGPPEEPSWAVDRLMYLFGDDLMLSAPTPYGLR